MHQLFGRAGRLQQDQSVFGVSETVWDTEIGGYQVSYKWLKDRKGRHLSSEEPSRYTQIIAAIAETARLAGAIDATVEAYGGWPGAFAWIPSSVDQAVSAFNRFPSSSSRTRLGAIRNAS